MYIQTSCSILFQVPNKNNATTPSRQAAGAQPQATTSPVSWGTSGAPNPLESLESLMNSILYIYIVYMYVIEINQIWLVVKPPL